DEALRIDAAEVAGVEPAVAEVLAAWLAVVAAHHVRAADPQLADVAADDAHFHARHRSPSAADMAHRLLGPQHHRHRPRLGGAIALRDRPATRMKALHQSTQNDRGAG